MRENGINGGRKRNCAPNRYNLHTAVRKTKLADHVTISTNNEYGNKDTSTRCAENSKSHLNLVQTRLSNKQAGTVSFQCCYPYEEANENTELTRFGDGELRHFFKARVTQDT
jgi:hypothetical protein